MATVSETIPELTRERALALYRGMVVIRRTEEGLAKAHAAGLIQGACHTYVGEEAVATGVSAHLRPDDTVLQHSPRSRPRPGQGRPAARADGRAVRAGHRLLPRARRQHAPLRARGRAPGNERDRRAQHPHGDRRRVQLSTPRDRSSERGVLRRRRRQQRSLPRGAQPRGDLALAGPLRLREQPLRDRGPVRDGGRQSERGGPRRRLRPPERSRRRERRPRGPRSGRRGGASGASAATDRRCSNVSPTAPGPTPRACATLATGRGTRWSQWKARCPIARWRGRLLDGGVAAAGDLDRIDQEVAALVAEAAQFAEASPWPDPDERDAPRVRGDRGTLGDARAHVHRGGARGAERGDGARPARLRRRRGDRGRAAATSTPPPGSSNGTAPSASATRRSPSAASPASAPARR